MNLRTGKQVKQALPWFQGMVNALFVAFCVGSFTWARGMDRYAVEVMIRMEAITDIAIQVKENTNARYTNDTDVKLIKDSLARIEDRQKTIEAKLDGRINQ